MQQVTDLHELAAQLQAAQRDVDSARSVVAHDKQERAGSLAARLVDALTTTQPEAVLNAAQARLAEVTQKGRAAAREWIVETARQRLAEQAADAGQHRDQGQRLERVQARAGQVRRWLELVQEADSRLSDARRACESASTTELLDAASKSKAISVLSCMSTSSAADLIMRAGQAVRALAEALPKHAEQASMDLPGDLCDLVVDLVFNPGFDVLSWFNVMRLGDAARQCKQAADKLRPLLDRLAKLAADAQAKAEQERAALQGIEAPYLASAAAEVPDVLWVPTPSGLDSLFQFRYESERGV